MSKAKNEEPSAEPFPVIGSSNPQEEQGEEESDVIDSHALSDGVIDEDEIGQVIQLDSDDDGAHHDDEDGEDDEDDEHKHQSEDRQVEDEDGFSDDSIVQFMESKDSIYSIAIDGSHVLQGDGNNDAYLWNHTNGSLKFKLTGHTDSVVCVGFSHDSEKMATASMDGTVRVYRVVEGSLLHSLDGPSGEIEWMEWHSQGDIIVAGCADTTTWMWNASSGKVMQVFSGHLGPVSCGAFTYDGKLLCTGSEDGSIYIWTPKTGTSKYHLKSLHSDGAPITSLAVHPSQLLLSSGSANGEAKLISIENGKVLANFNHGSDCSIEAIGFSHVSKHLATAGVDGKLKIWDLSTNQCRVTCNHDDAITSLHWHRHEPLVLTASIDKTIRLWDARTAEIVRIWRGHRDQILSMAVDESQGLIVSGGDDHAGLVFSISSSKAQERTSKQVESA